MLSEAIKSIDENDNEQDFDIDCTNNDDTIDAVDTNDNMSLTNRKVKLS